MGNWEMLSGYIPRPISIQTTQIIGLFILYLLVTFSKKKRWIICDKNENPELQTDLAEIGLG